MQVDVELAIVFVEIGECSLYLLVNALGVCEALAAKFQSCVIGCKRAFCTGTFSRNLYVGVLQVYSSFLFSIDFFAVQTHLYLAGQLHKNMLEVVRCHAADCSNKRTHFCGGHVHAYDTCISCNC